MGEEMLLNLKWDNFSSHLALSFDSCYESQQFVDVSLVCKDGEVIKGHKMILANTSKFFRRLLIENDHPHPMIVLHNIGADDLRSLMTFMYCGEVQIGQNDLKKLLEIADTLEVTGLQQVQETGAARNDACKQTYAAGSESDIGIPDYHNRCSKSNADFEMTSRSCSKPASDLLKYVSSLGQRSFEYSVQNFENSSKKLQEMAKRFEETTGGTNSTCRQTVSGKGFPRNVMSFVDIENSGNRLETLKTLDNVTRDCNEISTADTTERLEGQQRTSEYLESHHKKSRMSADTTNNSEVDNQSLNSLQTTSRNEASNYLDNDEAQNCGVYIKDEVDMDYGSEGETVQQLKDQNDEEDDEERPKNERIPTVHDGRTAMTSMLAAELLKSVASKRKVVENSMRELPGLSPKSLQERSSRNVTPITSHEKKLAFHEPRPCEICNRVYRDAATLRQHTFTMHTAGAHYCGCGTYFFTKYELTVHKKRNHY